MIETTSDGLDRPQTGGKVVS